MLRRFELETRGAGDHGSLNGATAVELVAEPPAGFVREVDSIRMANIDSAAVTIRVRKTVLGDYGFDDYEFDSAVALAVDGKFDPVGGDRVVRLGVGESITALMAGAAATTDPSWVSSWIDVPVPA